MSDSVKNKGDIGIVTTSFGSAFAMKAMPGLENAIAGSGYNLRLFETMSFNKAEVDFLIEDLVTIPDLKGIIYMHFLMTADQIRAFMAKNIRVVNLAGRVEGIDWVMADELKGAYDATRSLVAQGHRRIAMINGPAVSLTSRLREDGFTRALKEAGIDIGRGQGVQILNFVENEGYEATNLILDQDPLPTAIFVAAGDLTALGIYEALKERGLRIPGDISVVGYDNLPFAEGMEPPLTTVDQPLSNMVEQAMMYLIAGLDSEFKKQPQGMFFDPSLVNRESTAALETSE